jgi:hypothetical protein
MMPASNCKISLVIDNDIKQMFRQEPEQHVAPPPLLFSKKKLNTFTMRRSYKHMLVSNKFLKADQINHKGMQVYTANPTDYRSMDRHVDVIASFYTTMEQACSENIYLNQTWNAHKIIGSRTFRGTGTICEISNIKLHLNDSVTLADTGQCLTDRVIVRTSTNAVLWSQMRILVTNPFLPCTYSDINTASFVS